MLFFQIIAILLTHILQIQQEFSEINSTFKKDDINSKLK